MVQIHVIDIRDLMDLLRQRVTAHPSDEGCKKYLGGLQDRTVSFKSACYGLKSSFPRLGRRTMPRRSSVDLLKAKRVCKTARASVHIQQTISELSSLSARAHTYWNCFQQIEQVCFLGSGPPVGNVEHIRQSYRSHPRHWQVPVELVKK